MREFTLGQGPKEELWNRLRSLRKKRNLTMARVAVGAGISIGTLYQAEHGHESTLLPGTRKKIADFFGVAVDEIFPAQMVGNRTRVDLECSLLGKKKSERPMIKPRE